MPASAMLLHPSSSSTSPCARPSPASSASLILRVSAAGAALSSQRNDEFARTYGPYTRRHRACERSRQYVRPCIHAHNAPATWAPRRALLRTWFSRSAAASALAPSAPTAPHHMRVPAPAGRRRGGLDGPISLAHTSKCVRERFSDKTYQLNQNEPDGHQPTHTHAAMQAYARERPLAMPAQLAKHAHESRQGVLGREQARRDHRDAK